MKSEESTHSTPFGAAQEKEAPQALAPSGGQPGGAERVESTPARGQRERPAPGATAETPEGRPPAGAVCVVLGLALSFRRRRALGATNL